MAEKVKTTRENNLAVVIWKMLVSIRIIAFPRNVNFSY